MYTFIVTRPAWRVVYAMLVCGLNGFGYAATSTALPDDFTVTTFVARSGIVPFDSWIVPFTSSVTAVLFGTFERSELMSERVKYTANS